MEGFPLGRLRAAALRRAERRASLDAAIDRPGAAPEIAGTEERRIMDDAALREWIGRSETVEDEASLGLIRRLAVLLDRDPMTVGAGMPLPEGWHSVLFGPLAPQSSLGADGHPPKGDFLPPIKLPRRMFAGRRTRFLAPIRIGETVRRTSSIASITPKEGRSGRMVFVTIRHGITPANLDVEAVVEEQDLVFRPMPEAASGGEATPAPAAAEPAAIPAEAHRVAFRPDPVLLFRYSAVTFNGHRIHYDADYTRGIEGYPALVVNGGLTALFLMELAKGRLRRRMTTFTTRNGRPLFAGRPASLVCHAETANRLRLWALDDRERIAVEATAESVS
jgi:3-methylfumaryl-CoA hydratase